MSRINGEKARANITAKRRTAMREKLRLAKAAAAATPAKAAKPAAKPRKKAEKAATE
jgi:hypothetical protein